MNETQKQIQMTKIVIGAIFCWVNLKNSLTILKRFPIFSMVIIFYLLNPLEKP